MPFRDGKRREPKTNGKSHSILETENCSDLFETDSMKALAEAAGLKALSKLMTSSSARLHEWLVAKRV